MRPFGCQTGFLLLLIFLVTACGPTAEQFALAGQEAMDLAKQTKKDRDWAKAAKDFEESVKRDPTLAEVYRALAVCRIQIQDRKGAAEALRNLLRLRPDDSRAHLLLAQYAVEQKNWDEAVSHVVSARRFAHYRDEIQAAQYWLGLIRDRVAGATPETVVSPMQASKNSGNSGP